MSMDLPEQIKPPQQVRLINKIIMGVAVAALIAWAAVIVDFRVHEREDTMRFMAIEHVLKAQKVDGTPIVEKITKNTQIIENWLESTSIMYTHVIEQLEIQHKQMGSYHNEIQQLRSELARHHAAEESKIRESYGSTH